jgi:dTMP kinase
MPRGIFISLDGLDGTGKTTQCRLLADALRQWGYPVMACADPGGTPLGEVLRELLLGRKWQLAMACEALLFLASRAQLVADVIRPALEAGHAVVADRFTLANVVYQGHAGGLDPQLIWEAGKLATGGLEPDLTIVLDLPVETAQLRRTRAPDRFESRDGGYQGRVRAGFLAEVERRPDRIQVVDAGQSIEVVQAAIQEMVRSAFRIPHSGLPQ